MSGGLLRIIDFMILMLFLFLPINVFGSTGKDVNIKYSYNQDQISAHYHHVYPEHNGLRRVVKIYQILDKIFPQYGYINSDGVEIIPCQYLYATDFENEYAVVGDKVRFYDWENQRMDYWYINAKGDKSKSSFDFAITPDKDGNAIVGKLDGIFYDYCHPEFYALHYKYLKSDDLINAELTKSNQFPYTYVSKFKDGLARVSGSRYIGVPEFKDFYIDNSFNTISHKPTNIPEFINSSWNEWVFRDPDMTKFEIVRDSGSNIKIINNETTEEITPLKIEYCEPIERLDYRSIMKIYNRGLVGLSDSKNSIPCVFDRLDLYAVHTGLVAFYNSDIKKYGLINLKGQVLIPAWEYDYLSPLSEDYIKFRKDNITGILDGKGKILYSSSSKEVLKKIGQKDWFVFSYKSENYNYSSLKGIMSLSGDVLLETSYEQIGTNINNLLAVKKDGMWGFVDAQFVLRIPFQFKEVIHAFTDYGVAIVKKGDEELIIDLTGEVVLDNDLRNRILAEQDKLKNRQ